MGCRFGKDLSGHSELIELELGKEWAKIGVRKTKFQFSLLRRRLIHQMRLEVLRERKGEGRGKDYFGGREAWIEDVQLEIWNIHPQLGLGTY
jgi:hypothetical protein